MNAGDIYKQRRDIEELFKRRVHSFVDSRTNGNDYWWTRVMRIVWENNGIRRQLFNDIRRGVRDR